ncbi:uncharacterized protein LOC123509704 [Portunus trituberculatus]|uniref:uncharacterized protein LOC123509704 n=1 Tax=Portunus trituberculatus TaxID=210409 RepID=UPI001E1CB0BC|nr:uncharacterized protein LOC123509704 [Portunus trituberculatus]
MNLFKKMCPVKRKELYVPQRELVISSPTGVTHPIHIVIDKETNCLKGVPPGWREQMDIITGKCAVKDDREAVRSIMTFLQAKGNPEAGLSSDVPEFFNASISKPPGPWDANNGETTVKTVAKGSPTKDEEKKCWSKWRS